MPLKRYNKNQVPATSSGAFFVAKGDRFHKVPLSVLHYLFSKILRGHSVLSFEQAVEVTHVVKSHRVSH